MRLHLKNKRVHGKVHNIRGGKLYANEPMDSDKIKKLTSMMNMMYKKEQPTKKFTGKTFVL